MVGRGNRSVSSHSLGSLSEKFSLDSQRMDGGWSCFGLDQYENYFRLSFLSYRNSDRHLQTMARKGSYGPAAET